MWNVQLFVQEQTVSIFTLKDGYHMQNNLQPLHGITYYVLIM